MWLSSFRMRSSFNSLSRRPSWLAFSSVNKNSWAVFAAIQHESLLRLTFLITSSHLWFPKMLRVKCGAAMTRCATQVSKFAICSWSVHFQTSDPLRSWSMNVSAWWRCSPISADFIFLRHSYAMERAWSLMFCSTRTSRSSVLHTVLMTSWDSGVFAQPSGMPGWITNCSLSTEASVPAKLPDVESSRNSGSSARCQCSRSFVVRVPWLSLLIVDRLSCIS